MIYALAGAKPRIHEGCFVADSADLVGDIVMEEGASVWFGCVLRADNARIHIGQNSNVQDGSVLHVDPGYPLTLGQGVTVGHKVMLHGCSIGNNTLIGINAVILNGANIGKNCIIGANTLITENTVIPDNQMVLGSPGKIIRELDDATVAMLKQGARHYVGNSERYIEDLESCD